MKGCVCLVGFASLQSPWAYTPGIHAGGYGDWRHCDPPWGYAPNPLPVVKGCVCSIGFASLQSPWAYTPGIRAGAECGAAALTKQGRLKSVAHSRCTTQRHQRLTTRIGATPKARTLWLLAKSFARCKTNIASNAKHPFLKKYIGFFDGLKIFFLTILQVSEIRK